MYQGIKEKQTDSGNRAMIESLCHPPPKVATTATTIAAQLPDRPCACLIFGQTHLPAEQRDSPGGTPATDRQPTDTDSQGLYARPATNLASPCETERRAMCVCSVACMRQAGATARHLRGISGRRSLGLFGNRIIGPAGEEKRSSRSS